MTVAWEEIVLSVGCEIDGWFMNFFCLIELKKLEQ